jgi:hypothetical protein
VPWNGVQGYAVGANNAGTFGRNNDLNGVGVFGAAPSGTGVFGESATGFGVGGKSDSEYGVYGQASNGVGGAFESGLAAIRLVPAASGTGAPTSGAHQVGELYADSAGTLFYCTVAGSPGTWLPVVMGTISSSLTTVQATQASNITMSSANTFYDAVSVSLTAGTWHLIGQVVAASGADGHVTLRLWDGTTTISSSIQNTDASSHDTVMITGIATVATSATWKISCAHNVGGSVLYAAAQVNGVGSNAGRLIAVKIG